MSFKGEGRDSYGLKDTWEQFNLFNMYPGHARVVILSTLFDVGRSTVTVDRTIPCEEILHCEMEEAVSMTLL